AAGDALLLRGGTYNENFDGNSQSIPSGTDDAHRTRIGAYSADGITYESVTFNGSFNLVRSLAYVTFDHLAWNGQNVGNGDTISIVQTVNHLRFQHGRVYNAPRSNGIAVHQDPYVSQGAGYHQFIDMESDHNGLSGPVSGYPPGHGMYLGSSFTTVT